MGDPQNDGTTTDATQGGAQTTDKNQDDKDWETSEGNGGKRAVLADLANERKLRQALQTEADELKNFKAGLEKLVGGKEELDPTKLAAKLTESETRATGAEARATAAEKLLEAYLAAPAGADVQGLVDSVAFRKGLSDATDVSKYVKDFLKDNPRFAGTADAAGRRMSQGNQQEAGPTGNFNDVLRGLGR